MIEDSQLKEIRDLFWAIEHGVRWGRIPSDEATGLLLELRDRYPSDPLAIDGDAEPFVRTDWVTAGWHPIEHRKSGQIIWDPSKVRLVPITQPEQLRGTVSFNANVLDALIRPENHHRIPVDWKGLQIYFGDTIFDDPRGLRNSGPFVRCLIHCREWTDGCHPLCNSFGDTARLIVPA